MNDEAEELSDAEVEQAWATHRQQLIDQREELHRAEVARAGAVAHGRRVPKFGNPHKADKGSLDAAYWATGWERAAKAAKAANEAGFVAEIAGLLA